MQRPQRSGRLRKAFVAVPGRRNLQRELHRHDETAPDRQRELYLNLARLTPDRALVGQAAILEHLHQLGIRRRNNGHLTWRIVNRWRPHGCPILRGNRLVAVHRSPALSTTHALTAWLLTRPFATGLLFRVVAVTRSSPLPGSFTASSAANAA